jgi:RHS repeat-associated protein
VTATGRLNVALAANGAAATASSTATGSGFSTTGAINGNYRGPWGNSLEGWNDNTPNVVPDWIQVDFAGSKTIDEINIFSLHDNYTQENNPTLTQTFSLYGLIAFDVQYWNGSAWVTIPNGTVTGNNKVWRNFTFSPITTSKIRVFINTVPDAWSRVVEIQAFGTSAGNEKVQWLVADQLGTPRMIFDLSGALASMKRHDYLPFGEELFAPTGGRTTAMGYSGGDGVRQQFTSKERDIETGLDYFLARYYSSVQGRFTSPDEFTGGPDELYYFASDASANPTFYADLQQPQSLNKYQYVFNNPLRYVDPDGHNPCCQDDDTKRRVATGAATGATIGAIVGGVAGGVGGGVGGGGVGTLVAPGPGTVGGVIIGGGGGAAAGATKGAAVGFVIGGLVGYVYDKIVGPTPAPAPVLPPAPSNPPQSTTSTPPQSQAQPLPPPAPVEARRGRGGKQNKKDTGLRNKSDKEISKGARDRSLPKSERQRYKREEKARGNRNKNKRDENK